MDKQVTNNFIIQPAAQVEILSADLVPFISEVNTSMLLIEVLGINSMNETEDNIEMEVGILKVKVLQVLYNNSPIPSETIGIPFNRISDPSIRARNNINQWNNLALIKGKLLLFAGRITDVPNVLEGQAAIDIDAQSDPVVNAVRQCYVIEHDNSISDINYSILEEALTSKEDVLRYYVLDYLGRRGILSRNVGVEIICKAILSGKNAPDDTQDIAFYLSQNYFFDSELGNDSSNQKIVRTLTMLMVKETDFERRLNSLQFLASCVLDEFSFNKEVDTSIRSSLISAVQNPKPKQVINILTNLVTKVDEMDHEIIIELLDEWQKVEKAEK